MAARRWEQINLFERVSVRMSNPFKSMEAATGFEPVNNGFADRRLTTWLCRLLERETGFEPATSTLARLHSTAELFPPIPSSLP
jgi:hypothetical protein